MRRYPNLYDLILQTDRAFPQHIETLSVRRGDELYLELPFCKPGVANTIDIGSTPGIMVIAKSADEENDDRYDENPTLFANAFTRTTETVTFGTLTDYYYYGTLSISGGAIDKLLGVDDVDAVEVTTVQCVADISSSLAGKYFDIYTSATDYDRYWFTVATVGAAPSAGTGGTLRGPIDVAANASAATVAAALHAFADVNFTSSVLTDTVTFTALTATPRANPHPRNSGFTCTVTVAGKTAFTSTDVESVDLNCEIRFLYNGVYQTLRAFTLTVENNLYRSGQTPSLASGLVRSGEVAISSAASSVAVTFSVAMPSANWKFRSLQIINTTDGSPLNITTGIVTARSAAGFTIHLTGVTDSANYILQYVVEI